MERRIARPSSHPGTIPWTLVLLLGLSTSFRQGVAAGSRFSKLLQYFCQPCPDKCLSHLSLGSVGSVVGLERQTRCAASCHYLVISFRTTSGVRAEPPPTNAKHSSKLSSLTSANYATTRLLLQRAATPALYVHTLHTSRHSQQCCQKHVFAPTTQLSTLQDDTRMLSRNGREPHCFLCPTMSAFLWEPDDD